MIGEAAKLKGKVKGTSGTGIARRMKSDDTRVLESRLLQYVDAGRDWACRYYTFAVPLAHSDTDCKGGKLTTGCDGGGGPSKLQTQLRCALDSLSSAG